MTAGFTQAFKIEKVAALADQLIDKQRISPLNRHWTKHQLRITILVLIGRITTGRQPIRKYGVRPMATRDLLVNQMKLILQRPFPHQFRTAIRLQNEFLRNSLGMGIQNGNHRFPSHATNTQAVSFSSEEPIQAIRQPGFPIQSEQGLSRVLKRLAFIFDRDPELNPPTFQQCDKQVAMIRADISVTPRANLSRNRFQSKIQARQWVAFEEMVSGLPRHVAGATSQAPRRRRGIAGSGDRRI